MCSQLRMRYLPGAHALTFRYDEEWNRGKYSTDIEEAAWIAGLQISLKFVKLKKMIGGYESFNAWHGMRWQEGRFLVIAPQCEFAFSAQEHGEGVVATNNVYCTY